MPTVTSETELEELIAKRQSPYLEIWAEYGERSMAALINGNLGWLTFFRFSGDEGVWTFNPDCASDEDLDFKLDNGQVDYFPKYFCIDIKAVQAALCHFLGTGDADTSLNWGSER